MPSCRACWTTRATKPREPDHWACPGRRSTARSTSTGSSPRPADRRCDTVWLILTSAACRGSTYPFAAGGRPPATVRILATPGRIVVTVHDQGRGPADHLAGSPRAKPDPGPPAWTGLWAMHQLDIDVALRHTDDGFTVRLRSGTIPG